jgi:hypothetical protein
MAPARLAITPRNKEVHYYPADEPPTRLGCGRPCVRPDADYALSWIHNYGKGCVFFKALGHTPAFLRRRISATSSSGAFSSYSEIYRPRPPRARNVRGRARPPPRRSFRTEEIQEVNEIPCLGALCDSLCFLRSRSSLCGRNGTPPSQNTILAASWISRGPRNVPVIRPKLVFVTTVFGVPKWVRLNAL